MTRTPERLKDIDFSYIYFVTPHAVIVRKASGIVSVKQLAGRKASSASSSTAGGNLKEVVPDIELVYVRDYAIAFGMLKEGKVDAFPTDESVLKAIVQQDGDPNDYVSHSGLQQVAQCGICTEEGRTALQGRHQPRLLDIEASGEAARIFETWFGPASKEPMARTFTIKAD